MLKNQIKIALVDDDVALLNSVRRILEKEGYQVSTGQTGTDALALIRDASRTSAPVDILITDAHMPGMDGLQLLDALKQQALDVPVLAITGIGNKDMLIQLMRKGCMDFLDKPFRRKELLARIESILKRVRKRGTRKKQ